jgi:hypothetical protein
VEELLDRQPFGRHTRGLAHLQRTFGGGPLVRPRTGELEQPRRARLRGSRSRAASTVSEPVLALERSTECDRELKESHQRRRGGSR